MKLLELMHKQGYSQYTAMNNAEIETDAPGPRAGPRLDVLEELLGRGQVPAAAIPHAFLVHHLGKRAGVCTTTTARSTGCFREFEREQRVFEGVSISVAFTRVPEHREEGA